MKFVLRLFFIFACVQLAHGTSDKSKCANIRTVSGKSTCSSNYADHHHQHHHSENVKAYSKNYWEEHSHSNCHHSNSYNHHYHTKEHSHSDSHHSNNYDHHYHTTYWDHHWLDDKEEKDSSQFPWHQTIHVYSDGFNSLTKNENNNDKFINDWAHDYKHDMSEYEHKLEELSKMESSTTNSEQKKHLKEYMHKMMEEDPTYTYEFLLETWLEQHPEKADSVKQTLKLHPQNKDWKVDCSKVRCPAPPKYCAIGMVIPPGKCCKICIKHPYDKCDCDGECAPGFKCAVADDATGKEKKIKRCILKECCDCSKVLCKHLNCPVGKTKDHCGCCDVCYKNYGETCGGPKNIFGECPPVGFNCIPKDKNKCYSIGTCQCAAGYEYRY